ncbi:MAG: type II toxin-antitoxin system VapC family toxin [Truepera sp.]|nr:type II toxin-antitoxin system VapC family toxin [Truepera sp.]
MIYLLDTNICIYLMKRQLEHLVQRFEKEHPDNLGLSSITVAELKFGMEKSARVELNLVALDYFIAPLHIFDFGVDAAGVYGRLWAGLERQGTPIGPLDTLIAAHALSLGATLVTNNLSEFGRIPDLKLEQWV